MIKAIYASFITSASTKKNLDRSEQIKVGLMNKILLIGGIMVLGLALIRSVIDPMSLISSGISFALISSLIMLNRYGYYMLSRHLSSILIPLNVFFLVYSNGATFGSTCIFIICVIYILIMYQNQSRYKNAAIAWIVLLMVLSFYSVQYNFDYNPISSSIHGSIILYLGMIFCTYYLIHYYQNEIRKISEEQKALVGQLKQKNIELNNFAHIVSHDLKEPVKNISKFSQLIQLKLAQKNFDSVNSYSAMMHQSADQLDTIVEDTLRYTLMAKSIIQECDIMQMMEKISTLLFQKIDQKESQIIIDSPLPTIFSYRSELMTIFKNIIENGLKYNNSKVPRVNVDYQKTNSSHVFYFRDNGIGIDSKFHDQIFEMYQRLNPRSQYTGTGLGLSFCKKLVHNLKGQITVESSPNKGSCFAVSIPITCFQD